LLSWAFLLALSRRRGSRPSLPRRRIAILLLLGVLYVGNSYAYFASLQVVPISLASIISYLYPAIVAVMAIRLMRRLEGRRAYSRWASDARDAAAGGVPEGALPLWGLAPAFANPLITRCDRAPVRAWRVTARRLPRNPRRSGTRHRHAAR
jgi:hypothetical protein